jgi:hypothetical protein
MHLGRGEHKARQAGVSPSLTLATRVDVLNRIRPAVSPVWNSEEIVSMMCNER